MQAGKRARPPGSDSSDDEGLSAAQCLNQMRKLLKSGALSTAEVRRVLDEVRTAGKATAPPKPKRVKPQRKIDMSKYRQRYVALRMLYFGERLRGFASLNGCADEETAEGLLVGALERTRLISSLKDCAFSRSGRTDKGVSAFAQVVTLRIRSRAFVDVSNARLAGRLQAEQGVRADCCVARSHASPSRRIRSPPLRRSKTMLVC